MPGLRYLKRRLQALPASLPPGEGGSLINFRHLQFVALLLRLKYPKSLTAFHVYHHQFSCCISYSNLNSQRVFLLCDKHLLDLLTE